MVKEAVVNTYMEGRLDSIEKEMILLKRTNRILKRPRKRVQDSGHAQLNKNYLNRYVIKNM